MRISQIIILFFALIWATTVWVGSGIDSEHSVNKFIGAVVSKRDVVDFLRWTHPSNAFIAGTMIMIAVSAGLLYIKAIRQAKIFAEEANLA